MNYHTAEQLFFSFGHLPRRERFTPTDVGGADVSISGDPFVRLRLLLKLLGNPEEKIPHFIHVTGTSGKGSVCSYLQAILSASGQKTGLFISPHPTYLTERWSINGRPMPAAAFIKIIQKFEIALREYAVAAPDDTPSFFELCTAIALVYFAEQKVGWAVLEVGAGGQLDPTNIIPRKDAAVITTIGLDHTEMLGNTKIKIARAKAGIITTAAPVFTLEADPKVRRILHTTAAKNHAPFTVVERPPNFKIGLKGTRFVSDGQKFSTKAIGAHQAGNAQLALTVAQTLNFSNRAIKTGLATAAQPLRFEITHTRPYIILDGAHNPDKITSTVETMRALKSNPTHKIKNLHLVLGFSADKNFTQMIKLLATLQPTTVACTHNTANPFRPVASPADIALAVRRYAPAATTEIFLDPATAFTWSRAHTKTGDAILVTGSIFLSGELRASVSALRDSQ